MPKLIGADFLLRKLEQLGFHLGRAPAREHSEIQSRDGKRIGEVTSGGFGYTVERSIAYAYLPAASAEPGTEVEVEIFGECFPAVVQKDEPLWDPQNIRIKA